MGWSARWSLGALVVLGGLAGPVSAAPSAVAEMLMQTPTPLMSFGLVRLQDALRGRFGPDAASSDGVGGYVVNVSYDVDRDRIVLRFSNFGLLAGSADSCGSAFAAIRSYAGITEGGGYVGTATSSFYARQFMPVGVDAPELKGVAQALDRIIAIEVMPSLFPMTLCTGPLLGTADDMQTEGVPLGTLGVGP